MKTSVAFVAILGIFLMGIVIGALGMHLIDAHTMPWHPRQPLHPRAAGHDAPRFLEGLEGLLDLSPEQVVELQRIREQSHRKASSIRHEVAPRVHSHMEETHQKVLEILTPDQRERLHELRPPYWRQAVTEPDSPPHGHEDDQHRRPQDQP